MRDRLIDVLDALSSVLPREGQAKIVLQRQWTSSTVKKNTCASARSYVTTGHDMIDDSEGTIIDLLSDPFEPLLYLRAPVAEVKTSRDNSSCR